MTQVADCIFCRIIRGEIPSFQVFDDERTLAFMDINPAHPGHVLVIPKVHTESIFTIEESFLRATLVVAQKVARAVQTVFEPYGINIVQANGPGAAIGLTFPLTHLATCQRRWSGDELAAAPRG